MDTLKLEGVIKATLFAFNDNYDGSPFVEYLIRTNFLFRRSESILISDIVQICNDELHYGYTVTSTEYGVVRNFGTIIITLDGYIVDDIQADTITIVLFVQCGEK